MDLHSAEKIVLGTFLSDSYAIDEFLASTHQEMFELSKHRIIYEAVISLVTDGEPVDIVTVCEVLHKAGNIKKAGNFVYISELTGSVASSINLVSHIGILQDRFIAKTTKKVGEKLALMSSNSEPSELIAEVEKEISELSSVIYRKPIPSIAYSVDEMKKRLDIMAKNQTSISGYDTTFERINRQTGGFQKSDLIILAARPGMGKTSLMLNLAAKPALRHKVPVAVFSLEMSSLQLTQRITSQEAKIELKKILQGRLNPEEWKILNIKSHELSKAPIYIDDTASISIQELRSKALRLKREKSIQAVFVDYLQLMTSGVKTNNQVNEVTKISNGLKRIAKELDLPVIALSQLSRAVETRGGEKVPQLSDLRDSGSVEQDADMVIFLHRPEYYGVEYDEQGESTKGMASAIFAKHRNGSVGQVPLKFEGQYTNFTNAG